MIYNALTICYEFGAYRLETNLGLTRDGIFIPLPPKELTLLETLAAAQGQVVSQHEIMDKIWPQQDVSIDSLLRCVYSLRRALCCEGGDEYISTVPRRGYRLAVPVRAVCANRSSSVVEKSICTVPAAYSDYLEGLREANRCGAMHQQRAIDLFHAALAIDPNYATALSCVADCRMYQLLRGYIDPQNGYRLGVEACYKALSIDPELVSAIAALGWFEGVVRRDSRLGLTLLNEALMLDPCYTRGYAYRGWVLRTAGRLEESVAEMRTAVANDPHSLFFIHALAWSLFCAGECAEALDIERRQAVTRPEIDLGYAYTCLMGGWLGYFEEAIAAGKRALEISANEPSITTALSYTLARAGQSRKARELAEPLLSEEFPRAVRPHLAMTFVALNDANTAVALLRQAYEERCPWFGGALYDPRLDHLRSHPEVQRLYARESGQKRFRENNGGRSENWAGKDFPG